MKISVCWIAKNEESNIARSINSVKDCVDEMIVVDTGSTDRTVEVAESLGARVERFEWINDFSAARNYAVSLSTGDLIICPDADMWFVPAFSRHQRDRVEKIFKNPGVEAIALKLTDIDMTTGVAINEAFVTIVFKRSSDVKYFNPIHEQLRHLNGAFLKTLYALDLNVNHSGYSPALMPQKSARNLLMLREAARQEEEEGGRQPVTDFYLMRESLYIGDLDTSVKHFLSLHRNPRSVKDLLEYRVLAPTYFYLGLRIAFARRYEVSRLDIYNNLVLAMKKLLPDYGGADFIALAWQVDFDMKEDVFLEGLDSYIPKFDKNSSRQSSDSIRAFIALCTRAANICWRRNELARAFDYCVLRFKNSDIFDEKTFSILLSCIKGQPEAEIILFLNSLFDYKTAVKSHALTEGLLHDGFQLIFKYYVMKQIEMEIAAKKHFLQLLILNGNYEEAIQRALSVEEDSGDPNLIPDIIFFAIFCSGDMGLFDTYRAHLNENGVEILDCLRTGAPVASRALYVPLTLHSYYNNIAFLAGLKKAGEFLELFSDVPSVCFLVEAKYCVENSMFSEVLNSRYYYAFDDENPVAFEILLTALMRTGDFKQVLSRVKARLDQFRIDQGLLNHLLALAECRDPLVAAEARALYDRQIYIFDEYVDMDDARRTGIVFDMYRKRDRKRFSELSLEELETEIAKDDKIISHAAHLQTVEDAALVYEEKGVHTMALHCYMRLRACGYKTRLTTENLARVFGKLGNRELASRLAGMAEKMEYAPPENPVDAPPAQASIPDINVIPILNLSKMLN
jgi:glycosyltransferase involved in cell wall biosynthesis